MIYYGSSKEEQFKNLNENIRVLEELTSIKAMTYRQASFTDFYIMTTRMNSGMHLSDPFELERIAIKEHGFNPRLATYGQRNDGLGITQLFQEEPLGGIIKYIKGLQKENKNLREGRCSPDGDMSPTIHKE